MTQPAKTENPKGIRAEECQVTLTLQPGKYQLTPEEMEEVIETIEHVGINNIGLATVRLFFMGDAAHLDQNQRQALYSFFEAILCIGRLTY